MNVSRKSSELLVITSGDKNSIPYRWAVGYEGSRFLTEIRDHGRFLGIRCSRCGTVYVPPRKVCGPCFVEMSEWVELGDEGILDAFSTVNYKFIDPNTGRHRPIPFVYGYIRLSGADTMLSHIIHADDPSTLRPGTRLKAVFREDRTGSLADILHFVVIE